MKDALSIIEFYKDNKISTYSFESEISRLFPSILNLKVVLDNKTVVGTTNSSYIAALVPEYVNGTTITTLAIDEYALKNKLSTADVSYVLDCAERLVPSTIRHYISYINRYKDGEIGFIDCIAIYINCYKVFLDEMVKNPSLNKLVEEKTISLDKLSDLQLAIENGTESLEHIIEFISVHKLLPELALYKAEKLFQDRNTAVAGEHKNIDIPKSNELYAKMASLSTGIINPEFHQDLDPNYIPKR